MPPVRVRPATSGDLAAWRPLWDAYNAFYGRAGASALDESITLATWQRFFEPAERMHAWLAEQGGELVGLAHCLYHRSTSRLQPVCYLQDLYTSPAARRQGVARALIEAVYSEARAAGSSRVYWQTQAGNDTARALYDRLAQHQGFIVYAHDVTAHDQAEVRR